MFKLADFNQYWYVYTISLVLALFLAMFIVKAYFKVRRQRKESKIIHEQQLEKYQELNDDVYSEMDEDKLITGVLFNLIKKEEDYFENRVDDSKPFVDTLNDAQRVVFTIYKLETSLSGKNANIKNFFYEEEFEPYRPFLVESFEKINNPKIVKLLRSVSNFVNCIENNVDDDSNDEYSRYNFSDYTGELLGFLKTKSILAMINEYISENSEQFIEGGDNNEERTSTEI